MAEYLAPGVYTEEVESGAMPIEGASTSTAGFLGETERGPVVPQFLTSFEEFKRTFGGFAHYREGEPLAGTSLAYAVQGFFQNGGSRCYVGRVTTAEEIAIRDLGPYDREAVVGASVESLEFGEVVTGQRVSHTVRLRNLGIENDPAVTISDVEATVTSGDPGQFTVPPESELGTPLDLAAGDYLDVEVAYEPTADSPAEGQVEVTHSGVDSPLVIDLDGEGSAPDDAAELVVEPDPIDFGVVATGSPERRTVTVANDGPSGAATLEIDSLDLDDGSGGDPNQFEWTAGSAPATPIELDPGDETEFDVSFVQGSSSSETVEIGFANRQDESVDLVGDMVAGTNELGVSRQSVDFGTVTTGLERDRRITVGNLGGPGDPPLQLLGLDDSDSTITARMLGGGPLPELAPGEEAVIVVSFHPSNDTDTPSDLDISYENAGQDTLTLGLDGDAEDVEGELGAPDEIDFDGLTVDDTRVRTIRLTNVADEGASAVDILSADVDGGPNPDSFVAPEDPASADPLQAGESMEIPVEFAPDQTGDLAGELTVEYDVEGSTETHTIQLAGTGTDPVCTFEAVGPGDWGGRVAVQIRNSSRGNDRFKVTVRYWSSTDPGGPSDEDQFEAQDDPDVVETYDELSTDEASSNYYVSTINDSSYLVDVTRHSSTRPGNGVRFLRLPEDDDENGDDEESVGLGDFQGDGDAPRGERTGLAGFAEIDDISIVCIPDENRVENLVGAAVQHCQTMEDRFAVMQAPDGADPGALPPQQTISDYGAIYYPHIHVVDPETNEVKTVPPGGHVAGVYARTDADRGVHKAPANETLRGAVGLEVPVTRADQERLNPKGVNAIRSFEGRGIRIWGARTTSPNPLWKYVNVRRLMLYIEESIEEGTQWAVFEPNNEELWARLRQSVRNFLTTVWRSGALMGSSPDEAFYVKCDRTTMTQDDIDNGRLIVEIGVAPTKPAEFVVFRITQWTGGVEGGE